MKLTLVQMMMLGSLGAVVIIYLSMMNWRRAVYAAMVVALFEGAIRKWIFPQGSELVYFLKDIFLLGAYIKFFMFPDPDVQAWKLKIPGTLIACVVLILILTGAFNPNIGSPILAAYGLKIYLWYIPLGFMMPLLFKNEEHMTTILFRYSLFAIPICLLGAAQFVAGPDSWLNVYAASAFKEMSHVATFGAGQAEIARITGTFSYISGHAVFVQFFFILSICLFTSLSDKRRWVLLLGNMPLLMANGLMAGSRGAVFSILLFGAVIGMVSSVSKVGKSKNTFVYLMIGTAVVIMGVSIFFKKAYQAFETRRENTGDTTTGRMMYPIHSVFAAAKEVDITGFGIGMSHPAVQALRNGFRIPSAKKRCPLYDAETGQVLAELGWIGFIMWYGFRILIVLHCWEAYRRAPPSLFRSLALGFFCYHLLLLTGSFVLNHTANIFGCAAWGFCLIPKLQSLVRQPIASQDSSTNSRLPLPRGSKFPQNHPHRIGRD
jgi:hypothetical protein